MSKIKNVKSIPNVDELTEEERKAIFNVGGDIPPIPSVKELGIVKKSRILSEVDLSPISFGDMFSNLPVIKVNSMLPSGGLSYPEGYSIYYRPFVFSEVNSVSATDMSTQDNIRVSLNGIKTSFPVEELTFYDFTFISLLRKLSSMGDSKVRVFHSCKKCGFKNNYTVNVSSGADSHMEFWSVKYPKLPINVELKFNEKESREYSFSPLTIKEYLILCDAGLNTDVAATLAIQCDGDFDEMYEKISTCFGEDEIILREVDDLLTHGIKPVPARCANCDFINLLRLDSSEILYRPFRQPENTVKSRIRFG